MPSATTSPIPLVLIFTTVGFIVGAVVAYLAARAQPGKQPKSPDFILYNERKKRFDEIVGLWRERAGGKFVVWFEDKMLDSSRSIDPIRRRRLESAERDFQAWLGLEDAAAPPEAAKNAGFESRLASVTRTPTGPLSTPTRTPTGPLSTPTRTPTGPLSTPTRTPTGPLSTPARTPTGPLSTPARTPTGPLSTPARTPTGPLTAPKKTPTGPLSMRAAASHQDEISLPATMPEETPKPLKAAKPLSIVEQINDILQETIKDTPLAGRMIRLVEDPREGVVVWIGLEHYPGVDAVPDQEVKAALRIAASEWERRTELHR